MKAPFPYFGGKSAVAHVVWRSFGTDILNYVEPFFGSGAVLLNRPGWDGSQLWTETVNDKDGYIANFWRALQADPDAIAEYADWPVNENDLHARHVWLRERKERLVHRLEGDPEYYDVKTAGWWVWGICSWIGSGWCDPETTGPWHIVEDEEGYRQLVHLGDRGQGVNRQLVHLGSRGRGVNMQRVHLGSRGRGIKRPRVHLGSRGLYGWMQQLADRLRHVRVVCGDWSRVCGSSSTYKLGLTGVFLDPPYSQEERYIGLYAAESESKGVASECLDWCKKNGDNPLLRIALCGYDTEHTDLEAEGWTRYAWKARGGYGSQSTGRGRENRKREMIWFSPHCLDLDSHDQLTLFEG